MALQKAAEDGELDHVFKDESTPAVLIDLPETYAREGTADCPGGMCPLDGH